MPIKAHLDPKLLAILLDASENGREYLLPSKAQANSLRTRLYQTRAKYIESYPHLTESLTFTALVRESSDKENPGWLVVIQSGILEMESFLSKGTPLNELTIPSLDVEADNKGSHPPSSTMILDDPYKEIPVEKEAFLNAVDTLFPSSS